MKTSLAFKQNVKKGGKCSRSDNLKKTAGILVLCHFILRTILVIFSFEIYTCNVNNNLDSVCYVGWYVHMLFAKIVKVANKSFHKRNRVLFTTKQSIHHLTYLWWLSSARFKYKPGYRPCDLLQIRVLSLVENLFF